MVIERYYAGLFWYCFWYTSLTMVQTLCYPNHFKEGLTIWVKTGRSKRNVESGRPSCLSGEKNKVRGERLGVTGNRFGVKYGV